MVQISPADPHKKTGPRAGFFMPCIYWRVFIGEYLWEVLLEAPATQVTGYTHKVLATLPTRTHQTQKFTQKHHQLFSADNVRDKAAVLLQNQLLL